MASPIFGSLRLEVCLDAILKVLDLVIKRAAKSQRFSVVNLTITLKKFQNENFFPANIMAVLFLLSFIDCCVLKRGK